MELLTSAESNREKIKTFLADKHGKNLERYLKETAWEEDMKGSTKVYLVKDKQSGEIVIDKVLTIASWLGCQYLYLFAADHTEIKEDLPTFEDFIYLDADDEPDQKMPTYKLVEYYKNELKFQEVNGMMILKPYYDFECFSLFQPIAALSENRKSAWIQHSDINS